jgi:ABC-type sulfate transport system substrate-binding protein
MWSSHPAAVLDAEWVTPAQKAAASKLLAFLRGAEAQRKALRYGFRPSDTSIPILTEDADNPFNKAKAFGVTVDIPNVVEAPPGPVIHNLMVTWSRLIDS